MSNRGFKLGCWICMIVVSIMLSATIAYADDTHEYPLLTVGQTVVVKSVENSIDYTSKRVVNDNLPKGISYDDSTRTLTLENCTIDYAGEEDGGAYINISDDDDYCIVLKGSNILKGTTQRDFHGILSNEGGVSITGDGSLQIDLSGVDYAKFGIYAAHRIDINGPSIKINGGEACKSMFYGISLEAQKNLYQDNQDCHINIKNANVEINSKLSDGCKGANVGLDSQDADMFIENSTIQMTLTKGGPLGIGSGQSYQGASGFQLYGGKLSIDDKSWITIKALENITGMPSVYYFQDDIKSKCIYVANEGEAAKKADKTAIQDKDSVYEGRYNCYYSFVEFAPGEKTHENPVIPKNPETTPSGDDSGSGTTPSDGGSGSDSGSGNNSGDDQSSQNGNWESTAAVAYFAGNETLTYDGKVKDPKPSAFRAIDKEKLVEGTDYKLVWHSDRKRIGRHCVTVEFLGKYAAYNGSSDLYYTIKPAKAKLSKAKAARKKIMLTWKKQGGGVKYQIAYKYKGGWKYKTSKKAKYTLKKLKSKKTYQVKVRAFKKIDGYTYNGSWSKVKKVKVK